MKTIIKIILYLWQLPQIILGLILLLYYKTPTTELIIIDNVRQYISKKMQGGISLGPINIIDTKNIKTRLHEYGHSIQSRILGPLYLIVIGIPSIIWAAYWNPTKGSYYKFYTEKWANKLGGVNRYNTNNK